MMRILRGDYAVSRKAEWLLAGFLLAAFVIQGIVAILSLSATGDETHYLGMGRYLVKTQRWDLPDALLHPPLSYYLHSLPLYFVGLDDTVFSIPDLNSRGRAIMASRPDDRLLAMARVPVLLLAAMLGLLVFIWSREAYGSAGALLSLFLFAFNPVVLSDAVLITPDLCLAFFCTLTAYLLWRYLRDPSPWHSIAIGASLGLALLSKYSAVLAAIAVVGVLAVTFVRQRREPEAGPVRWGGRDLALILLAAAVVVNAGYLFHGSLRPLRGHAYRSRLFNRLQSVPVLKSLPLPLPEAYVSGLDLQHTVVEEGFWTFFLGDISRRGWFHYYLVAFLLKSPLPFLLVLLLAARNGPNRGMWVPLVVGLIFPLYFSAFRLSRGIRYILPVYPLLCVWAGRLVSAEKAQAGRALKLALPLLLLWYAGSSILVAPHYLAYISELGGGPGNGIRLLFESDFDWGQELKGLKSYMEERGIDRIKFVCFSTADPAHYGISYDVPPCEKPPKKTTGLIAASATALQMWDCYGWLKEYQPVAKIGYTIFIYDIPPEPK